MLLFFTPSFSNQWNNSIRKDDFPTDWKIFSKIIRHEKFKLLLFKIGFFVILKLGNGFRRSQQNFRHISPHFCQGFYSVTLINRPKIPLFESRQTTRSSVQRTRLMDFLSFFSIFLCRPITSSNFHRHISLLGESVLIKKLFFNRFRFAQLALNPACIRSAMNSKHNALLSIRFSQYAKDVNRLKVLSSIIRSTGLTFYPMTRSYLLPSLVVSLIPLAFSFMFLNIPPSLLLQHKHIFELTISFFHHVGQNP